MGYNAGGCCMSSSSLIAEAARRVDASTSLYDRDGFAWAKQQAEALRRRDLEAIDWENVIEEIEGVGQAEQAPWVTHCEKALECMLLIEHWKSPSVSNLKQWQSEIRDSQLEMSFVLGDNPSLRQECAEMLSLAWGMGRFRAVTGLTKHLAGKAGVLNDEPFKRAVNAQVPEKCPYLLKHVAGYDPKREKEPEYGFLPPAVVKVLERSLWGKLEIPRGVAVRDPGRSR